MRVLIEVPYEDFKLSIFKMGQVYLIKAEQAQLEQTYKLDASNLITDNLDELFKIIDEDFINNIRKVFSTMHGGFKNAFARYAYV